MIQTSICFCEKIEFFIWAQNKQKIPLQWIILPKKSPWNRLKFKKILEKIRENMWWHVPRFFQKTFMAMPASIAFILWNQRAGMNKRSPDARTSLDMDKTLDFDCYSLGKTWYFLIILQTLNQSNTLRKFYSIHVNDILLP